MTHLILHVGDTDATIDFWCAGLGATLESDQEMEAPALDAIFGRGLSGLSFRVPDFDHAHAKARSEGRSPTEIYTFDELERPVRMFFLEDPDGPRLEMIEQD